MGQGTAQPWLPKAACLSDNGRANGGPATGRVVPEWFFPLDADGRSITDVLTPRAAKLCGACPVREECFEWGLYNEVAGTWGGHTEEELGRLRRGMGIRLDSHFVDQIRVQRAASLWLSGGTVDFIAAELSITETDALADLAAAGIDTAAEAQAEADYPDDADDGDTPFMEAA